LDFICVGAGKAKALFDYVAQATNQLSLQKGKIYDLSHYGGPGGWSKGTDDFGRSGFFPSDYIELVKATPMLPPAAPLLPTTTNLRARVLYNFAGSTANEMSLTAGQIIEVVRRGPAGGWSKGLAGAFPADFVEHLPVAPAGNLGLQPVGVSQNAGSLLDLDFSSSTNSTVPASNNLLPSSAGPSSSGLGSLNTFGLSTNNANTDKFDAFADIDSKPSLLVSASSSAPSGSTWNSTAPSGATVPTRTSSLSASVTSSLMGMGSTGTTALAAQQTSSLMDVTAAKPSPSTNSDVAAAKSKPKVFAIAKYARIAQGSTELTIAVGDEIEVVKQDSEWWYGSVGEGTSKKTGFFPGNYVQLKGSSEPRPVEAVSQTVTTSSYASKSSTDFSEAVNSSGSPSTISRSHQTIPLLRMHRSRISTRAQPQLFDCLAEL
jgi:hypothetical protein